MTTDETALRANTSTLPPTRKGLERKASFQVRSATRKEGPRQNAINIRTPPSTGNQPSLSTAHYRTSPTGLFPGTAARFALEMHVQPTQNVSWKYRQKTFRPPGNSC